MSISDNQLGVLHFTVDSALLRELGERLVGKAHIALAELVKNSYDADAENCDITFGEDRIEVVDDGNGMTLDEFRNFWMKVGATHKQKQRVSPRFSRPLTGSKGVGRLAVQFLARKVSIESTADNATDTLKVSVDWDAATRHELITQAEAKYQVEPEPSVYACGKSHGFRVVLTGLQQHWDKDSLEGLAQEIWTLRPPFEGFGGLGGADRGRAFNIHLTAPDLPGQEAFEKQIEVATDKWIAKIEGRIDNGRQTKQLRIQLRFRDNEDEKIVDFFPIEDCALANVTWEIRIYNLSGHLGGNIKVGDARTYFSQFGGVHVYDGPFRLPYYGIQQDWLGVTSQVRRGGPHPGRVTP